MMQRELTRPCGLATTPGVTGERPRVLSGWAVPALMLGAAMLGGCVQVTAPDKPIVIELNVNIRQEVIYRLAADAGNTIEENEDIF
jgi:hypothetical protein